jgi:hypothetical protein
VFDWILFLREQLNASLPGSQSQNQSTSHSPPSNTASHLGPNFDVHLSWPYAYPMDSQSGQAQLLKHNEHMHTFYSHPGTEAWARLRPSPDLPTYLSNISESRLHSYNSYSNNNNQPHPVPRSLAATTLPYIPDENRTSYTTNALGRTSLSNLNARGSHDGHQRTSVDHPLSRLPIDESTVKYHNTYMHSDDGQRGYNRYFISRVSPGLNLILSSCVAFIGCSGTCHPLLDQLCHMIHLSMIHLLDVRTTLMLKVSIIPPIAPSFFYLECTKPFLSLRISFVLTFGTKGIHFCLGQLRTITCITPHEIDEFGGIRVVYIVAVPNSLFLVRYT